MKQPLQLQYTPTDGATKFLIMVENQELADKIVNSPIESAKSFSIGQFVKSEAPIQKGDEYFLWTYDDGKTVLLQDVQTEMQHHYADWASCIDVGLKRVQDLNALDVEEITLLFTDEWDMTNLSLEFEDWLDSNFGANTYDKNGYFWVVSIKQKG